MKSSILIPFENLPYFTLEGFRQIASDNLANQAHARIAISRWVKAGYVIRLKNGIYMHRSFYERNRSNPEFSAVVSAIIQPISYLSLEYILQVHGILTDITFLTSAITPKNTITIDNSLGAFHFSHLKVELFKGYKIFEAFGIPYSMASKAKALFDLLYLRPLAARISSVGYDLAEDLRLNLDEFSDEDKAEFYGYIEESQKPKMKKIFTNLEKNIWRY